MCGHAANAVVKLRQIIILAALVLVFAIAVRWSAGNLIPVDLKDWNCCRSLFEGR